MGQYCDSQKLERYWYHWILSSSVPQLEIFREIGILWTKVIGYAQHDGKVILTNGKPLPDPSYPIRRHCLALDQPLFFSTNNGCLPETLLYWGELSDPPTPTTVPFNTEKLLQHAPSTDAALIAELHAMGYVQEFSTEHSWHIMLENIRNICNGISMKFHLPSEEEQQDLASDAFLQVTNKLVSGRLVYMPGRAPVFNLLTTTTYRIMYSITNKKNNQKYSMRKLIDDAAAGVLPEVGRSVRVPTIRTLIRSH